MSVYRTIGPLVIESLQNFSFTNCHDILTSSELDLYKDLTNDQLGRVMRKPVFLGFRQGLTQTGLYRHRRCLET